MDPLAELQKLEDTLWRLRKEALAAYYAARTPRDRAIESGKHSAYDDAWREVNTVVRKFGGKYSPT